MESLYLLIPVALVVLLLAIKLLFWAISNGQYDDLETEAHRILFDDDDKLPQSPKTKSENSKSENPKSEIPRSAP